MPLGLKGLQARLVLKELREPKAILARLVRLVVLAPSALLDRRDRKAFLGQPAKPSIGAVRGQAQRPITRWMGLVITARVTSQSLPTRTLGLLTLPSGS